MNRLTTLKTKRTALPRIVVRPVTPARWSDLERLFGARGACGGCWCMFWRLPRAQYAASLGTANRRALKRAVSRGTVPGLLAYAGAVPVGWCAVAPRADYPRLAGSRILKPVDDQPVWSIPCFFVARPYRKRGVTVLLLRAAAAYAARRGARIVEGYPIDRRTGPMPDVFAYTGLATAFRRAGFTEAARRSATRPIMRKTIRWKTA